MHLTFTQLHNITYTYIVLSKNFSKFISYLLRSMNIAHVSNRKLVRIRSFIAVKQKKCSLWLYIYMLFICINFKPRRLLIYVIMHIGIFM